MNPFESPDEARLAAASTTGPRPEDVEATFIGPGPSDAAWKLSVTPQALYLSQASNEQVLRLDKRAFADQVNIGVLTPSRVALVVKASQRHVVMLPREAIEHVYAWLEGDAEVFRRRILRAGWGSTLAVGLLFLVPSGDLGLSQGLAWVSAAVLIAAALVSRLTAHRSGFILRAVGWTLLGSGFVYGVVQGHRPYWMLIIAVLLSWGVLRYVRMFRFFGAVGSGRDEDLHVDRGGGEG